MSHYYGASTRLSFSASKLAQDKLCKVKLQLLQAAYKRHCVPFNSIHTRTYCHTGLHISLFKKIYTYFPNIYNYFDYEYNYYGKSTDLYNANSIRVGRCYSDRTLRCSKVLFIMVNLSLKGLMIWRNLGLTLAI